MVEFDTTPTPHSSLSQPSSAGGGGSFAGGELGGGEASFAPGNNSGQIGRRFQQHAENFLRGASGAAVTASTYGAEKVGKGAVKLACLTLKALKFPVR